ncbi:MAG: septum formation protein Maf [Armatimonadetes bacterium]|nr:septum formation protein Maf [Armatimonadota bacterium]
MALRLKYSVVLGSASPRRVELLKKIVPEFVVDPAHIDEDALTDSDPYVTAQRLAREKAIAVFERHPDAIVIAGDTVVAVPQDDGSWMQLAKPADPADACRMLGILQGRSHKVITGIAIRWPLGLESMTDAATVTFKPMTVEQIEDYVATGEPLDKAGAYGAQGLAQRFLERLEGDFETVVGLPVKLLEEALRSL